MGPGQTVSQLGSDWDCTTRLKNNLKRKQQSSEIHVRAVYMSKEIKDVTPVRSGTNWKSMSLTIADIPDKPTNQHWLLEPILGGNNWWTTHCNYG